MGQDFTKGRPLFDSGRRLTARDILLAAASGHATLPVVRKPVVALLSTGDELVEPGTALGPGQISASNSFGLAAVVEAAGAKRACSASPATTINLSRSVSKAPKAPTYS